MSGKCKIDHKTMNSHAIFKNSESYTKYFYEIKNYFHEVTLSFKRRITVFGYTAACYKQL